MAVTVLTSILVKKKMKSLENLPKVLGQYIMEIRLKSNLLSLLVFSPAKCQT